MRLPEGQPFRQASWQELVTPVANERTAIPLQFPQWARFFTQPPEIFLQFHSVAPDVASVSPNDITLTAFTLHIHRTSATPTRVFINAVQSQP